MNYAKTAILLASMTALFMAVGVMLGGSTGMIIALIAAGCMNFFSYWYSDKFALSTYGAQQANTAQFATYHHILQQLAERAEIPTPRFYIIPNQQPNAFATGRNPENAAVAVTTGLIDILSLPEIAGVLAHEVAHIKNRDCLIMTVTATIAGALGWLANLAMFLPFFTRSSENQEDNGQNPFVILIISLLAPIIASIVQMAISRTREYDADKLGAILCGNPEWLASSLYKIENSARTHYLDNRTAEDNPATAHLFIINPLSGKRSFDNLFSTHPATQNRIQALRTMKQALHPISLENTIDTDTQKKNIPPINNRPLWDVTDHGG